MEILEVSAKEYAAVIGIPYHVFGTAAFNELNSFKCDEVSYLLFRESKFRLGLIGGIRDKMLQSPFSAPFGGYSYISTDIRLQYIDEAAELLKTWASGKGILSIKITLPPLVYDSSFISKQINCLWRHGFEISEVDLDYFFDLEYFNDSYLQHIRYNSRKNLKIALSLSLKFFICKTDEEKKLAYEIILKNREYRGYPLRMSWEEVSDTVRIIQVDFFIVNNNDQAPVASAIVFHVSESVVQVIYWGDLPGYSEFKPMNFISFKVFEYYKYSGKKVVDVGPSTENSMPNYGLCEFKESVGCKIDPKYTLIHSIK